MTATNLTAGEILRRLTYRRTHFDRLRQAELEDIAAEHLAYLKEGDQSPTEIAVLILQQMPQLRDGFACRGAVGWDQVYRLLLAAATELRDDRNDR